MILFSSLFTLLLRLSLLVQGPVEEVSLDWSSLLGVESPVSSSLTGEHLETVHGSFNGIGTLVPSIEVEEKVEVESESTTTFLLLHSSKFVRKDLLAGFFSIFGNKAIRGSLLPLYDFFHSWKIHLS
jgi:hypothetical protein